LDNGFVKILKKLSKVDPHLDVELVKSIYRSRLNEERSDTACDDLRRLSAVGWNEYEDFDGNQFTRLKHSYSRLVDYFLSQIPKENLMLSRLVERVMWSSGSHVELGVLNRVTGSRDVIVADFVITTTSLGYLKSFHHSLFEPKLPLNKIKAIENLGFGVVNKVFVVFEKPLMKLVMGNNAKPEMLEGFFICLIYIFQARAFRRTILIY
jgi:hypothetical protein